jgi:ribose transport system ATP-binding protein
MADATTELALKATGITKRYPGVTALDGVDFELRRGEVHVLFGENGAGKSTLIQVISGAQHSDEGTIEMRGEPVHLGTVAAARSHGISAVFQEFSLAPSLTIEENLVLGAEPGRMGVLDKRATRRLARERLEQFGFGLDPKTLVSSLSRAEQQMVEIAKAFRPELAVLILDEPTASLTDHEAERLFELVNDARTRGVGIIYVTHRMAEIRRLADRVTVLRDGKLVTTVPGHTSNDELITLMTGRVVEHLYPTLPAPPAADAAIALSASGLATADGQVLGVDFTVRAGEIVGFAGLVGSGKSSAARACFGLERLSSGRVEVNGVDRTGAAPSRMLRDGMVYLPSDRKKEGLFLQRSLRESVTLPWLGSSGMSRGPWLRRREERAAAAQMLTHMELSPADPERPAAAYSGGNQQKGLLGRALMGDCNVYLLDEPTVGVDAGARVAIYDQIVQLAEKGYAVVVISSDLPEILNLTHRTYVFSQGHVSAELAGEQINEKTVLRHMMHWDDTTGSDAA